jgi:hypothetical protein
MVTIYCYGNTRRGKKVEAAWLNIFDLMGKIISEL